VIRIIHTSDIHLDACYAQERLPAAFGNRRRQSLRDVFQHILQRAADWPADAVLIAGDVFEQDRVTRDTVSFLHTALAAIQPIPVFIAPGNHDPAIPNSPYRTETWPDNVTVFTSPEWQAVEAPAAPLTIHGFGFDGIEISRNPFGSLAIPRDGRVHLAVGHGSEMGSIPPGKGAYAPFQAADATPDGLAYLGLGHFHGHKIIEGPYAATVAYSGAPEGHGFGELGERVYLEVEIENGQVRLRTVPCNRTLYFTDTIDCTNFGSSQQVVEAIRELPKPEGQSIVARITLSGENRPEWRHEIPAIRDALARDFEYLDLVDATLQAEDFTFLARERTSLGAFVARLNAELDDSTDLERRRMLVRARDVGLAAYRGRDLPLEGAEGE
jgi:DNA repair exonuclease SbcCD nuclease subunit